MEHYDDRYHKFWPGLTLGGAEKLIELNPDREPLPFTAIFGGNQIVLQPGNIPAANNDQWLFNGMLKYQSQLASAKLIYLADKQTFQANNVPIRNLYNQARIPEISEQTQVISAQFDSKLPFAVESHLQFDYFSSSTKKRVIRCLAMRFFNTMIAWPMRISKYRWTGTTGGLIHTFTALNLCGTVLCLQIMKNARKAGCRLILIYRKNGKAMH